MGLFSKLFGGSKTTVRGPEIFEPQRAPLEYGYKQARNALDQQLGTPYYQGPTYAPLNADQYATLNATRNFTGGTGSDLFDTTSNAALLAGGAGLPYFTNAKSLASGISGPNAKGAFSDALGFSGVAGDAVANQGRDISKGIFEDALSYANGDIANNLIDAASRDVTRNLYENDIYNINSDAIGSGNFNSTRAGVSEGIARRGAADRVADIGAKVRNDLFNTGINTGLSTLNYGKDFLTQGLDTSLKASQLGLQGQLQGNEQLGRIFSQIPGLTDTAMDQGGYLLDRTGVVGDTLQADTQGKYDEAFQRWIGGDQRALGALAQYMGLVGTGPTVLGTPNVQQTSEPGILGRVAKVASGLKSIF